MKRFLRSLYLLAAILTLVGAASAARAETYPDRPIRMIIGLSPGGAADILARLVARHMGDELGQNVLVENRPGAGGTIGAAVVAKAPADGYTLLFVTSGHASNATLFSKLRYNTLTDFAGVSGVVFFPMVVVVNSGSNFKSLNSLVDDARARPGTLNYASAGGTGLTRLSAEEFLHHFKLDVVAISYKGSGPALTAIMANQVDFLFDTVPGFISHSRSGKLRALAVTTRQRSTVLTDVPTIAEEGAPGFDILGWFGILAPADTPRPIVDRLNKAIQNAQVKLKKRFTELGVEPLKGSAREFDSMIKSEVARWGKVIKRLGLRAD